MTTVRQYLITKKAELEAKLTPVTKLRDEQQKALAKTTSLAKEIILELTEVDTALSALFSSDAEAEVRAKTRLTIKQAVLSVLKDFPQGLSSGEILKEINTRFFDGTIKRESLSPQLTRLRRDNKKLDQRGDLWIRRVPENEATLFATKN